MKLLLPKLRMKLLKSLTKLRNDDRFAIKKVKGIKR